MATTRKAASKPAAKKAAPKRAPKKAPAKKDPVAVEQASVSRDSESGALLLEVNAAKYSIAEQDLLNLRREINDVAAGFVH